VELGLTLVLDPVAAGVDEVLTSTTTTRLPDRFGTNLVTPCNVVTSATVKSNLDCTWYADGEKLLDALLHLEALQI